jgi:hypothetical protein
MIIDGALAATADGDQKRGGGRTRVEGWPAVKGRKDSLFRLFVVSIMRFLHWDLIKSGFSARCANCE